MLYEVITIADRLGLYEIKRRNKVSDFLHHTHQRNLSGPSLHMSPFRFNIYHGDNQLLRR